MNVAYAAGLTRVVPRELQVLHVLLAAWVAGWLVYAATCAVGASFAIGHAPLARRLAVGPRSVVQLVEASDGRLVAE
jgi:hypothetical protein